MGTRFSVCRICGAQTYDTADEYCLGLTGSDARPETEIEFCSSDCFNVLISRLQRRVTVANELMASGGVPRWDIPTRLIALRESQIGEGDHSLIGSVDQVLELIRGDIEYHRGKGRRVTYSASREMIPEPPREGDNCPRHRKGSLTIIIRAEVP